MSHIQRSDNMLVQMVLQTLRSSGAQEPFGKIHPLFAAGLEKFSGKKDLGYFSNDLC